MNFFRRSKPAERSTEATDAASAEATMRAINAALRARGGAHAGYSCKAVSWDDVSRGDAAGGGALSCWGANITDTYLKARDGTPLYTVRADNWNERLGIVASSDVALVAGNAARGGGPLAPLTLRAFLARARAHGAYAGLDADDLSDDALDARCSIRFQTTFLPVSAGAGGRGAMQFAPEAYNYNTTSDADPRNLVLLCTTQGVAVQQDGAGAKRLYHHAVDEGGRVHRYWLEAERSAHAVGGAQAEGAAERADAVARGKATASVIGTAAMGARFNALMTVQVPLKQKERPRARGGGGGGLALKALSCSDDFAMDMMGGGVDEMSEELMVSASSFSKPALQCRRKGGGGGGGARAGVSNAARVSRGDEHDVWGGLGVTAPERHPSEHVTITVVLYNTVAGGVPSEADVVAAVDDLERLYAACGADGRLADAAFGFMKEELAAEDAAGIATKVATQPYVPPPTEVVGASVFPVDGA